MSKAFVVAVMVVASTASCMALSDMESARARSQGSTASSSPPRPSSGQRSSPPKPAGDPAETVRPLDPLRVRLNDALKVANDAVAAEGSEAAAKMTKQDVRQCSYGVEDCATFVKEIAASDTETLPNKIVLLASAVTTIERKLRPPLSRPVMFSMENYVQVAEFAAAKANGFASGLVQRRAEIEALKKKAAEENAALDPIRTECKAAPSACQSKCDGGNAPLYCVVRAEQLDGTANLPEAKTAASRACDKGIQTGCLLVQGIEAEQTEAKAKLDESWQNIEPIGDDIARKRFQAETFAKIAKPHQKADVAKMKSLTDAIVTDKFCPVRKTFVTLGGAAEFSKRAATHCKDQPPEASGLSGAQVALPDQCRAAFASGCP